MVWVKFTDGIPVPHCDMWLCRKLDRKVSFCGSDYPAEHWQKYMSLIADNCSHYMPIAPPPHPDENYKAHGWEKIESHFSVPREGPIFVYNAETGAATMIHLVDLPKSLMELLAEKCTHFKALHAPLPPNERS